MRKTDVEFGLWRVWFTWRDAVEEAESPFIHDEPDGSYIVGPMYREEAIKAGKAELPHGADFGHLEFMGSRILR